MKLLYCSLCNDIFNLDFKLKKCSCGNAAGRYLDEVCAEYSGENVYPLGFDNLSLKRALQNQPLTGGGKHFAAFVIAKECFTMWKETDE